MSEIDELIEYFRKLPGIGPRQAKRFAYFLISQNKIFLDQFADSIRKLKNNVSTCKSCFRFFAKSHKENGTEHGKESQPLCPICSDNTREKTSLMIVSRDIDFEHVEKSGFYKGLYFILGGSIPLLEKNPEGRIRGTELSAKIKNADPKFSEIILAMNMTAEGENTEEYLKQLLQPLAIEIGAKISVLGRGLSTGTELEYSDQETIRNALKNRS